MPYYHTLLSLITYYLINGLFMSVLIIIIAKKVLRNRIDIQLPVAVIKWILIGYAILNVLRWLITFSIGDDAARYATINRMTGPYWYISLLMLLANIVFPLLLSIKKLGSRIYAVFVVSLLVYLGWLMQTIIITLISIRRDYVPSSWIMKYDGSLALIMLKGAFVGLLILIACNWRRLKLLKAASN